LTATYAFAQTDSGMKGAQKGEMKQQGMKSAHSPALPHGHPVRDVKEGYWSSTTNMFESDWAWAVYLTRGAVGVGQKKGAHFSVWAVRDLPSRE
jgi:hypothetical protein